ncbi:MAG: hypothetical protein JWN71_3031 [Xanthobacteraceae bacterium]|nr:hypothetical protein [Xanthobacteraceae bacterium]
MRGFRFVVVFVALAVLFSRAPMFGADVASAQEIPNSQVLRSWD